MSKDEQYLERAPTAPSNGTRDLSGPTGMTRLKCCEVRLPPADETDLGELSEGFVYVLSGSGELAADGQRLTLGPGDFIGITDCSAARVRNCGEAVLVYLSAGRDPDIL